MKKMLLPILLFIYLLSVSTSCKKTHSVVNCGCNSDSIAHYVTYDNFGGFKYLAAIFYDTLQNQNSWFISVGIPNTNNGALLKVCNPKSSYIKNITDTISNKYTGAPILFYGRLKRLCTGESFGTQLPETLTFHVIIDSLKNP